MQIISFGRQVLNFHKTPKILSTSQFSTDSSYEDGVYSQHLPADFLSPDEQMMKDTGKEEIFN